MKVIKHGNLRLEKNEYAPFRKIRVMIMGIKVFITSNIDNPAIISSKLKIKNSIENIKRKRI